MMRLAFAWTWRGWEKRMGSRDGEEVEWMGLAVH